MNPDVIIPFRPSPSGRTELDLCIKGIKKHLKNYRNIVVIEDEAEEPLNYTFKEANIFKKLLKAANDPNVSQEFLYMNDDHFLLTDYDARTFPYYHCGNSFAGSGEYRITINNTKERMGDIFNFDCHCPMLVSKDGIKKLQGLDWDKPWGYLVKTMYAYQNKIKGVYMPDFKLKEFGLSKGMILDHLKERPWFSTSDKMFTYSSDMEDALNQLYK